MRLRGDKAGSGRSDPRDRAGIDSVRPAVLRQMEQRIAADQRHIAPAGTVNVSRLASRYQRLRRDMVWLLAGAGQFGHGQSA
jgi:hypothetical protein